VLEKTMRVTYARARAQTTRSSARCICCDPGGKVHLAWEDVRNRNFEIYYTSISGDSVLPEVRITRSLVESSYPAVTCDSQNAYIVWEEVMGRDSEVFCVRLHDGQEVARTRVTDTNLDSSCPVCAAGGDGAVHVAWHEGPFKQTAIYYARVEDDSVVQTEPICTTDPEAFRPDIACDGEGRVMIVWLGGLEVKSRLWNGVSWEEEELVAETLSRPWRISVTSLPDGEWATSWFHRSGEGEEVFVKFFDGSDWYGLTRVSGKRAAYYPNVAATPDAGLAVVWEERDVESSEYAIALKCHNGGRWSEPLEIYRQGTAGRYASLSAHEDLLHAVWFSAKDGANEIYYGRLRKR
jgi:hypothetical protein